VPVVKSGKNARDFRVFMEIISAIFPDIFRRLNRENWSIVSLDITILMFTVFPYKYIIKVLAVSVITVDV
jgi:hypothetical protein